MDRVIEQMQGVKEQEDENCEGEPSGQWVGGEQGLSRYLSWTGLRLG